MPEPAHGAQMRSDTPFEKVLRDFVAGTGSRPPNAVYYCHPAYEALHKAVFVAYQQVYPCDQEWAEREANYDAQRLLYYITQSPDGALLYDSHPPNAPALAENVRELRDYFLRCRLRDRAVSRGIGEPASKRPFAELIAPSYSELFEAIGAALVSSKRPKGANSGELGRAYDQLRLCYVPNSSDLIAPIEWGADYDRTTVSAAKRVFYEAFLTPPKDWLAEITATAQRIQKDTQMYLQPQKPTTSSGLKLVRVGRLEAKEPDYVIDGLIERDSTVTIFGDPGCGKSFLALDMAMCVSTGTAFHGRDVRRGPVIYLAGEGQNGLIRRVEAWCRHNGVDRLEADLFLSNKAPQLLNRSSMNELAAAVSEAIEEVGPPSIVFVDTVARAFGGGDENSTKDMSAFIAALDAIRAKLGCTIVLVHHSGHSDKQRARGSMALKGAVDAEYRVEKKGKTITVENHKMKDGPPPPILQFQLDEVVLGRAKNGKDITSAVLRETDHFKDDRPKKLTANQQLGVDTYEAAVRRSGTLREDGSFAGIHLDVWREDFYREHPGDNIAAKKKAFQRTRDSLLSLNLLRADNDVYFPGGDFPALDEARYVDIIKKRDTGQ